MRLLTAAATQMACAPDRDANIARAEALVRDAAAKGAQLILLQELFETPYFCKEQEYDKMALATRTEDNPAIRHFRAVARELRVVLPVSFFEAANNAQYNSLVMIDADGEVLGLYRKSHIPDGPGYREKFYFNPGDTGFKVWDTAYGRVGVAICWDQWFPEAARAMALQGAEVICYPTAIGTEPQDPTLDSRDHWQRTMQGHAAANLTPVIASNRVGTEEQAGVTSTYYGSSFITDGFGAKTAEMDRTSEGVIVSVLDLEANRRVRLNWGVFRDRRPELYAPLLTLDGSTRAV
jgi:N-carbamoylputrescine amidase